MNIAPCLLFIPVVAQGLMMMVDEFYYHRQRRLSLWEIIGHPLDTLTVIIPLVYAYSNDFTVKTALIYSLLSAFSCIFIVKDELIHKDVCSKGEMLLHALLFICHPMVFLSMFFLWRDQSGEIFGLALEWTHIVLGQLTVVSLFLVYQISYWGIFNE